MIININNQLLRYVNDQRAVCEAAQHAFEEPFWAQPIDRPLMKKIPYVEMTIYEFIQLMQHLLLLYADTHRV